MSNIDRLALRTLAFVAAGLVTACGSATPANLHQDSGVDQSGSGGSSANGGHNGSGQAGGGGATAAGNAGASGEAGGGGGDMGGQAGAGNQMTCKVSKDCGRGSVCDTASGLCVDCLANADCGMQKCDVPTHTCVDCLANADCPAGTPACSTGHTCGNMCNKAADCPRDLPACEVASHACVECVVNADCGAGGVCQPDRTCQ